MADLHSLFETFHTNIRITQTKKNKLRNSKDALRKKIISYFEEHHPEYVPKFRIQGSYKMGSAIRTKDDTCDLDDGVYFLRKPDVSPTILQTWVYNAVKGHTKEQAHRKKCISVLYFENDVEVYNIDIPVYYKLDDEAPRLAIKNGEWSESDPKEMTDWFVEKKKQKSQVAKIVRHLKSWCDHVREKMPSGLAMTVLACNAIENVSWYDKRDDVTLKNMLKEIRRVLKIKFECIVPAVPNDDLFANYDNAKRQSILKRLDDFITDAEAALEEKNELKASRLWGKHLGNRFPEGEDKNQETNNNGAIAGLGGIAKTNKPWSC